MPKKVLVIDDDSDTRTVLGSWLSDAGWIVYESESAEEGLMLARKELPDLILMDVMLPGVDGFEALRRLRNDPATGSILVIMLTAVNQYELGADHDAESTGRRLGVPAPEGFINKPVDREDFLAAIAAVVSAS